MKKNYSAVIYILLICFLTMGSVIIPQTETSHANEEIVIPDEAIRLRILANSDSEKDQAVKRDIRDEVNANITEWVKDLTSLETAREVIKGNLPEIQRIAEEFVDKHGLQQQVKVDFGPAKFPTKLYGQFLYPAGEYEAIVITLGEGTGANWWCVLFPPLCFLDFSNGTAVSISPEEEDDSDDDKQVKSEESESKEKEDSLYVSQDEEEQVVEKRFFIVDFFKKLFS